MVLKRMFLAIIPLLALACGKDPATDPAKTDVPPPTEFLPPGLTDLKIIDKKVGKGDPVQTGDFVIVRYEGKFKNGSRFDSSGAGGYPFTVGARTVIEGWEKGVVGMKVGGTRQLEIPSKMAYGSAGSGLIPPNSDLYFEITLLGHVKKGMERVMIPTEVKVGTGRPVDTGDTITIHAVTKLVDGSTVFDTKDRKEPQTFTIGAGRAYPHLEEGVKGMRLGGVRKLRVPPAAGFGNRPLGMGIPANMILDYQIELIKVKYKGK